MAFSRMLKHTLALAGPLCSLTAEAAAAEFTINLYATSSSLPNWPDTYLGDGNLSSAWSSNGHPSSSGTEWFAFWWSEGMQATNYVKFFPRYSAFGNEDKYIVAPAIVQANNRVYGMLYGAGATPEFSEQSPSYDEGR